MKQFEDIPDKYDVITQIYDDNTNMDEYINIVDTHIPHTKVDMKTINPSANDTKKDNNPP